MTTISLNASAINRLDLSAAEQVISTLQSDPGQSEASWVKKELDLTFSVDYPREASDPRELSEIPEIRLWFIRLDAQYPWLPLFLDWKAGELGRYVAMLVPHQFHPTEGIQYNPEALEIWVMRRVFLLLQWHQTQGLEGTSRIKGLTQMLGYELDDAFFALLA